MSDSNESISNEPISAQLYIEDIFRRADANDDGSISKSEFKNFFADGVLSSQELEKLFEEIETNGDGAIDISELTEFFDKSGGEYTPLINAFLKLNAEVSHTLQNPKSEDDRETFMTRFFIREIVHSITCLKHPLDAALSSMVTSASSNRLNVLPFQEVLDSAIAQKAFDKTSNSNKGISQEHSMGFQIERLAALVDKMSGKAHVGAINNARQMDFAVLVSYEFHIRDEATDDFKNDFQKYVTGLQDDVGCAKSTCVYDEGHAIQYEIWESQSHLDTHTSNPNYRTFHKSLVDHLEKPLKFNSMSTPLSWWM